ncbi:putative nucleotidyltransferase protein [metagenome]|uniref:Putative nucleotidyltransferase protein n=1 Tax=metagenome TaxID=256318 RepID=A0A2P2CAL7_9ZZZZ
MVLGNATETSDLDITVLLDATETYRESLTHEGWPVELFVHTESSIRHFVAKDRARRRPTMARLVSTGTPLVEGDAGESLRAECAAAVADGPEPLSAEELTFARYSLTDQLDDLAGGGTAGVVDAVAIDVWRGTAELLLASRGWWSGTGKWLIREVEAMDAARGTSYAPRLHGDLHSAMRGSPDALVALADEVLDQVGGRLWSGFRQVAVIPT